MWYKLRGMISVTDLQDLRPKRHKICFNKSSQHFSIVFHWFMAAHDECSAISDGMWWRVHVQMWCAASDGSHLCDEAMYTSVTQWTGYFNTWEKNWPNQMQQLLYVSSHILNMVGCLQVKCIIFAPLVAPTRNNRCFPENSLYLLLVRKTNSPSPNSLH